MTSQFVSPSIGIRAAGDRGSLWLRRLRLGSGLVVGAFLVMHLLNLSLGLVAVHWLETARPWLSGPWRSPPGTILLYGALAVHFALSLRALYQRRSLRMTFRETMQTLLGLALPFLLVSHVIATRVAYAYTGEEATYPELIRNFWVESPMLGLRQSIALLIAWLHLCLGVAFWRRSRPSSKKGVGRALYTVAILLPVLALLGFSNSGRIIAHMPEPPPNETRRGGVPPEFRDIVFASLGASIAFVFVAQGARSVVNRRRRVRIRYVGGGMVDVEPGSSVLEASRLAGRVHPAVCGGRGRCSTCRVRILSGEEHLHPPNAMERATLQRIKAPAHVRLACQIRPVREIEVAPILPIGEGATGAARQLGGDERDIAVMFCDLRDFTALAEHRLPFDTVFLLNQYFEIVAAAVESEGGHVDKFVGDGVMALFGLDTPGEAAARQAVAAAHRIREGIQRYNAEYSDELAALLRIAIAIHYGPAIVGEMGAGRTMNLTAIGDTINVASRLEQVAKDFDAELVLSDDLRHAGTIEVDGASEALVPLRGRSEPMKVWSFARVEPRARADDP